MVIFYFSKIYFLYHIPFLLNGLTIHPIPQIQKSLILTFTFHSSLSLPVSQLIRFSSQPGLLVCWESVSSPYNNSSFYTLIISHSENCISLFLNWHHCTYPHLLIIHSLQSYQCNHFKSYPPHSNFSKPPIANSDGLQDRGWSFQACQKQSFGVWEENTGSFICTSFLFLRKRNGTLLNLWL